MARITMLLVAMVLVSCSVASAARVLQQGEDVFQEAKYKHGHHDKPKLPSLPSKPKLPTFKLPSCPPPPESPAYESPPYSYSPSPPSPTYSPSPVYKSPPAKGY